MFFAKQWMPFRYNNQFILIFGLSFYSPKYWESINLSNLGYTGFEFWYEKDWNLKEMKNLKDRYRLTVSNFDCEYIPLTDNNNFSEFEEIIYRSIETAHFLDCHNLTLLSGPDNGRSRAEQRKIIIEHLQKAAELIADTEITITLEATNRRINRPDNFLVSADEAFEIIERVSSNKIKMLFDIYHQQISEGDLLSRMLPNIEKIGHIHAAGVPDRHELDRSEINYAFIFDMIKINGYDNWIGLEYYPQKERHIGLISALNMVN